MAKKWLIQFIVFVLAFAVFSALANFNNDSNAQIWGAAFFLTVSNLTAYLVVDYFLARHQVDSVGLRYTRVFGSNGFMDWLSVSKVSYSAMSGYFKLRDRTGDVARISKLLENLDVFATLVLDKVNPSAIDDTTRDLLVKIKEGYKPGLYS